jgi:hypothetical protein
VISRSVPPGDIPSTFVDSVDSVVRVVYNGSQLTALSINS